VYYSDFGILLDNVNSPFNATLTGIFTAIDTEFSKKQDLFMKFVSVETDAGLLMSDLKEYNRTMTDSQRESISSNREGRLYSLVIQMSAKSDLHIRKYRKIFYFIAQLGGYIKAFVLFGFIYRPFLKRKYYIDLINHLYQVDGGEALRKDSEVEKLAGLTGLSDMKMLKNNSKLGNDAEKLIVWRKFDFFEQSKKDELMRQKLEQDEQPQLLGPGNESSMAGETLSMEHSNTLALTQNQESTLANREVDFPGEDEDLDLEEPMLDTSLDFFDDEDLMNDDEEEEVEELQFTLRDWMSVLFPMLRSEKYGLYEKVSEEVTLGA
jgi:hypothetical protein